MTELFLFSLFTVTALDARVQPVAGAEVAGQLVALDSNRLALKTGEGETSFPLDDLFWAAPEKPPGEKAPSEKPAEPAVWIELTDGSRLLAAAFTVDRGTAKVRLTSEETIDVRTRAIHSVLLKSHQGEPGLAEQWAQIVARKNRPGDIIVIRQTVEKTVKTDEGESVQQAYSLDFVDGVLYNITSEAVQFELDGQLNDVPRSRVEGVIYYHPQGEKPADPLCRVTDVFGSIWSAGSLAWRPEAERLAVRTTAGAAVELSGEELERLDFSVGKLQYLSDLEPTSVEFTARQSGGASDSNFAKLYAFKKDRALLDEGPLLVAGKEYKKGLAMASRTTATFVLPEGYRRFRALAAIDDRAGGRGNVELVITADGRELTRQEIDGAGEPVRLDLDISGVRRLTILADWGKYGDRNDDLDLCEARITK
jgi:hypothetical protein